MHEYNIHVSKQGKSCHRSE